ncbi:MAG: phosphoenolpyruvate synthase [Dehalococcoidia bacterium]|nr:phosphoenolpyruvate synthase [Dehalococcoidia bacterium]MDW8120069.1 phosphoenolpyruvate synthase [Chloroflexota bacterium]
MPRAVLQFHEVGQGEIALAGGKGASLGEMVRARIPVPPGFIVSAAAYREFLESTSLQKRLKQLLHGLDHNDSAALQEVARQAQRLILETPFPAPLAQEIAEAYQALGDGFVAVRSSATAEDLPQASFAGQQSTFLNVRGVAQVLHAVQACWASLFGARAIFYRAEHRFDHLQVAIAVVVQRMVQSEVSGVLFTVDPVTRQQDLMVIEAVYGLGEAVVGGALVPDFYPVRRTPKGTFRLVRDQVRISRQPWKLVRNPNPGPTLEDANLKVEVPPEEQARPKLTEEQVLALAALGARVEARYGYPVDIEWALEKGTLYILQARPITTLRLAAEEVEPFINAPVLLQGDPASPGVGSGPVRIVRSHAELSNVQPGDVLVAEMTTPDYVPAMKRAVAIVTEQGGRTCHAAIVSREMGLPCVVGAEGALVKLRDGQEVTVHGTLGKVYAGIIQVARRAVEVRPAIRTRTRLYVNLADPSLADRIAQRPVDGVGLLRAEFIIAHLGSHPRWLLEQGRGHEWTENLAKGVETFARAFYPRPVVYRLSDLKTNEYRNLEGGKAYEPEEENPMLGWRGARRYVDDPEVFALEVEAIRRVRERWDNLYVMVPFVRTPQELAQVKALLEKGGLSREHGLKLWMMVEVPSNVILLEEFLKVGIDGVSIGSNDLTQLVLGADRDNARLRDVFEERDPAVLWCMERTIAVAKQFGATSSICGQAPSFYPDLTEQLVRWGITSVSVSPDVIDSTREVIAAAERRLGILPPQDGQE